MTRQERQPGSPPGLQETVSALAHRIDSLGPGDRAALRRMNPEDDPPLVFVKLALQVPIPGWEHRARAWQTLAGGMALVLPPGARSTGLALGRALAESDYSEARLERLLASDGATLRQLFLRACRFLAAKGATIDWLDAARLLLATNPDPAREIRLRIATYYFRTIDSSSPKTA